MTNRKTLSYECGESRVSQPHCMDTRERERERENILKEKEMKRK